jgi:hypothetical protein
MVYSHKGYKIDKNKSSVCLNLHLRDCYAQKKYNGNLKTACNSYLVY